MQKYGRGSQVQNPKAIISIAALAIIGLFCFSSRLKATETTNANSPAAQLDMCADCHSKHDAETISLYSKSAHAKSGLTCNRCHGGDWLATKKEKAHSASFIGSPDPNQIISMCGSCHRPQLAMFKEGAHSVENQGRPRLDCSQCHGAHAVGSPTRAFSFAYYCAGCHGLEYLPALPQDFQEMLKVADDVSEITGKRISSGRPLSEEETRARREIRRRISEIVHPTDSKGGSEKIPQILRLGERFKSEVGQK